MKKLILPMLLLLVATGVLKAQINETFESGAATLTWEALDGTWNGVVNNPSPNAVNNSAKVGRYIKRDSTAYSLFWAKFTTPINLATNNKFKINVLSNKTGSFIFKLEGPKGNKEVSKKIVNTGVWQSYDLDFSSAKATDSLNRLILFFDAGVGNSKKDTFWFDNIQQLPADACAGTVAPATQNLLDDFECQRNASYAGGWDSLSVVTNPNKTGVNTSASVGKFNDQAGNNTEYGFLMHNNLDPIDLSKFPYLRMKVLAPRAGLMLLKLEGGAAAREVGINITAAQVGQWVEVAGDFTPAAPAGNTKIVLFFNAGVNGTAGDVYYIDDIRFTETPPLESFEPQNLTWAPLSNDATLHGAFTLADNPNAAGAVNKSAKVGKYAKGTAVISTLTGSLPTGFKIDPASPQLTVQVYAPDAGKTIKLQLVSATQGNKEASATVTAANTWEDLKFDFSAAAAVADISQINVIFDGGTAANGKIYYFDNLSFGKLTINACGAVAPNPLILDDFECQRNGTYGGDADRITAIANPQQSQANLSEKVGQYIDRDNDPFNVLGYNYTTAINLSRNNQFSIKIWSPKAVPMLAKLEGGTSAATEKAFNITAINQWVTYDVDFSDQKGKDHKRLVIFFNFNKTEPGSTYFIDDVKWKSEPITGCAVDLETPIVATYFANGDLGDKPVAIVDNPKKAGINTSNKVIKFDRRPGGEVYAGAFTDLPAPMKWTNTKYVIRAKVLMDHIGNFSPKVEPGAGGSGTAFEISKANTKVNEWEEITADFSGKITGNEKYNRLTFFIDLTLPAATVSQVSYIDDIVIGDGAGCVTTGIFEPITVERLSVYPNPATNELTIRNTEKVKRISIANMLGQNVKTVVFTGTFDMQTISLEGLKTGLYTVSAYDEKGLMANSKFVKE
jgi:Secretion system C-terminal sorting domain